MSTKDLPKLLNCPFCGGEVKITRERVIHVGFPMFQCDGCGALVSFDDPVCNYGAINGDDTPAILAWNKRATN